MTCDCMGVRCDEYSKWFGATTVYPVAMHGIDGGLVREFGGGFSAIG